jgi:hypothetical protein
MVPRAVSSTVRTNSGFSARTVWRECLPRWRVSTGSRFTTAHWRPEINILARMSWRGF